MIARYLMLIAAAAAIVSPVLTTPARADDRHVLLHCENVLARAAKAAHSTKALRVDAAEVKRCQMVIREFVSRESRMPMDENGRRVR